MIIFKINFKKMLNKFIFVAVLGTVISSISADPVPSQITKCKAADADCLKENAVRNREWFGNGLPEYNVTPMDPVFFSQIDASSENLKLTLTDITIRGLKTCNIHKLARNTEKSTILVELTCDVIVDGQYEMDGHLLVLPIQGKGKIHAKIRKVHIQGEADMVEYTAKDGKKHWKITTWTHNFELKDKAEVKFDNLFDGSESLSKAVKDLVKNNGNDVVNEIAPNVIQAMIGRLVENVSRFFKAFSVEELSLDH